jgi:hypothetical protein
MKGQRYATDKVRSGEEAKRQREEFLETLEQVRKGAPYPEVKS